MNMDLTEGKPGSVLTRFCIPLFGSVIFQQLYNIADSLVAGRYIGEGALAAVGNSYEVTLIFIAFAMGCNIGCSVITARFFGAKDHRNLKTSVSTAIIASLSACLVLMVLGLLGGRTLLGMMNTPQETMDDSLVYLRIYTLGLPFLFMYNISTGIFSALGDSKTPFWFLAASSLSNIAVDIIFVKYLGLGVAGVAEATFLCQGVSSVLALIAVVRRLRKLEHPGKAPLFSFTILRQFLIIAIPSILQQSFISIGNILIQSVINGFGVATMAGYSAGVKLNNMVITSLTTMGNGVSSYTAQNLGAGKNGRIRDGFRSAVCLVWLIALAIVPLYVFGSRIILSLFIEDTASAAMNTGVLFLRILSPFYFVVSVKLIADGVLRGSGLMRKFMGSTFLDLLLRVALSFILSRSFGSTGIWLSWPIGWTIATCVSLYFFASSYPKGNAEKVA